MMQYCNYPLSLMYTLDIRSGAYMQITRRGAAGCNGRSGIQHTLNRVRERCVYSRMHSCTSSAHRFELTVNFCAAVNEAQGPWQEEQPAWQQACKDRWQAFLVDSEMKALPDTPSVVEGRHSGGHSLLCSDVCLKISSAGGRQCPYIIPRGLHDLRATYGLQDKD